MKRIGRIVFGVLACLPLSAAVCMASVISAANSSMSSGIQLVGTSASGVDAKGEALFVIRDSGNNPVVNATVEVIFASCCAAPNADIRLQPTQPHPNMGWTWPGGIAKPVAYGVSNALGQVRFRIVGGATAVPGNNPGITTSCVLVRADGQVLGNLRVGAYDLNSSGGVNAADQSLFLGTLFSSPAGYRCRADYNGDGLCNSADLSKILSVQFSAGSSTSGAAMLCP